ncbi:MAG: DUF3365 domain-containing protein [Nitrospira sp.]|nr:DUF3365 domain-containing protein [Nitrospira sp.]
MIVKAAGRILGKLLVILFAGVSVNIAQAAEPEGILPELMAEYIHAVIQADRNIYSTHVVEQLQDRKIAVAAEDWKEKGALPLPAQLLQMTGQEVQGLGLGLHVRLSSLGPIYIKNGPMDEFERAGLEAVAKNPRKPYTGIITEGDRRYFKAIFADRAVSMACVICHNNHPLSVKRDYKLHDVMGGIIISFPVR